MTNLPQQYYWWVYIAVIFDLLLKAFALWRAARNDHKYWFIALLIINSVGIVPLVYIIFFSKWDKIEKYKKQIFKKKK